MFKDLLKRWYQRVPGVRELIHIRDRLDVLHSDITWLTSRVVRSKDVEIHRFLDFELRQHPRYSDPQRLLRYEFQVCSQNGEDGIIREIFRRVGETDRTFVELGAGDGVENNTTFLLTQGWKGFWLDGNARFVEALEKAGDIRDGRIKWLVSMVTRENAAALFQQLGGPREFDLLSLDVDQNTYHLWDGLREYRPRVVVVEYNSSIPSDLDWKVHYVPDREWDSTHNFGASLKVFENLGRQIGYSLVGCEFTGLNAFFVRDDLVGDRFVAPFTSENHYEPPRLVYTFRRGHKLGILDRIRPT
jgi:hypothetical protein